VRTVVNWRVCKITITLDLIVVMSYKSPINTSTIENLISCHLTLCSRRYEKGARHHWLVTFTIASLLGHNYVEY
jgi:hypothetical protein